MLALLASGHPPRIEAPADSALRPQLDVLDRVGRVIESITDAEQLEIPSGPKPAEQVSDHTGLDRIDRGDLR